MRSKIVNTLVLALLLSIVAIAAAQQPGVESSRPSGASQGASLKMKMPPEKQSKLEEMLAEALKHNPDIRVAAAKLAEADAELNRTRLLVTQKVVTLYYGIEAQKKTIAHQEEKYKRLESLNKSGAAVGPEDMAESRQALALAKGKLQELEAQLPALLGKAPQAENAQAIETAQRSRLDALRLSLERQRAEIGQAESERTYRAIGPMAERLRKALQTPVKVGYTDGPLKAFLEDLMKKTPGLSIRCSPHANYGKVSLHFEEPLPVSAVLQALEDDFNLRFIVREYGILVPDPQAPPPPGAITVEEFLRNNPADESRRPSGEVKNPPAENVEGLVKNIDSSGLMTLTIGSDAGLTKGHTLELFRLNPSAPSQSRYLGTVRIVETQAHQSVAQPVGRLSSPPQPGDRVSSRLLGKKPPAKDIQGLVKSVDGKGLITISIGSDAGLDKGQTLELYWMPHSPPINDAHPFGTVRIVEVEAHQAVVEPIGRLSHTPQSGDRIIGHLQKNER